MASAITRVRAAVAAGLAALALPVLAADPTPSAGAQARYEQERAACLSGTTGQDREACLREAGAALQRSKRGYAEDSPSDVAANRLRRCEVHPTADAREECIRRMNEGTVTGTVAGGGQVREHRTIQYGN
jgi:hypothetical protein